MELNSKLASKLRVVLVISKSFELTPIITEVDETYVVVRFEEIPLEITFGYGEINSVTYSSVDMDWNPYIDDYHKYLTDLNFESTPSGYQFSSYSVTAMVTILSWMKTLVINFPSIMALVGMEILQLRN